MCDEPMFRAGQIGKGDVLDGANDCAVHVFGERTDAALCGWVCCGAVFSVPAGIAVARDGFAQMTSVRCVL